MRNLQTKPEIQKLGQYPNISAFSETSASSDSEIMVILIPNHRAEKSIYVVQNAAELPVNEGELNDRTVGNWRTESRNGD